MRGAQIKTPLERAAFLFAANLFDLSEPSTSGCRMSSREPPVEHLQATVEVRALAQVPALLLLRVLRAWPAAAAPEPAGDRAE